MSHTCAAVNENRIPHPYASDYKTPSKGRVLSYTQRNTLNNYPPHPFASTSATPQRRSPHTPTSTSTYQVRSSRRRRVTLEQPRTPSPLPPLSAPVPLSTPPPNHVEYLDPIPSFTHNPSEASGKRRLVRPGSRVWRDRKKAKKVHFWELKPITKYDPIWKGLYTLPEVNEAWVRVSEELLRRLERFEEVSSSTSPIFTVSPRSYQYSPTSIYQLPSARASSQLLVPSPVHSDLSISSTPSLDALSDSESPLVTPILDSFDPFISPIKMPKVTPSPTKGRRPPPLNLSQSRRLHPYASSPDAEPTFPARQPDVQAGLLSPLPIASPGVVKARSVSANAKLESSVDISMSPKAIPIQTQQSRLADPCTDLEFAMSELLASAGELTADIFHLGDSSLDFTTPQTSSEWRCRSTDSDLLYLRPESTFEDLGSNSLSLFFPLPPARMDRTPPPRPPRNEDMGMSIFFDYSQSVGDEMEIPDRLDSPSYLLPPRTPRTPEVRSISRFSTPSPPPVPKRRAWKPSLTGDHSFLTAMSRGDNVNQPTSPASTVSELMSPRSLAGSFGSSSGTGSSRTSTESTRSLPKRAALPESWKAFGIERL